MGRGWVEVRVEVGVGGWVGGMVRTKARVRTEAGVRPEARG